MVRIQCFILPYSRRLVRWLNTMLQIPMDDVIYSFNLV